MGTPKEKMSFTKRVGANRRLQEACHPARVEQAFSFNEVKVLDLQAKLLMLVKGHLS